MVNEIWIIQYGILYVRRLGFVHAVPVPTYGYRSLRLLKLKVRAKKRPIFRPLFYYCTNYYSMYILTFTYYLVIRVSFIVSAKTFLALMK
jgi:hypothetical protein